MQVETIPTLQAQEIHGPYNPRGAREAAPVYIVRE